jgi:PAS domain S-box-containing protein
MDNVFLLWLWCVTLLVLGYFGIANFRLRKTVQRLRQQEERFALAVHGTEEGLWDWDIGTNEVYYAPRFKEMLGFADDEFPHVFSSFESRLHPDDHDRALRNLQQHLAHQGPCDTQYRLSTKDGSYRWFQARGQASRDEHGQPVRVVGSIRDITTAKEEEQQLQRGAVVLTSAINQITASLSQFASSAAETATSVQETAVTMAEVKQMATATGQKAKELSANARQTAWVSQTGEQTVQEVLGDMNRLREQMGMIAHSVTRLGEQSQTIQAMINLINDVAEQSNLLSINAAIEAAKAGDYGKGFSVVAKEIQGLAGRSKQAAAQVRKTLGDIRKATTEATHVTEQGVVAATSGVRRSVEAGDAIHILALNITESTDTVTQITNGSSQQLRGIEQVTLALENIRNASVQNVDGIRQIERAAQDLQQLGQTLTRILCL